MLPGPVGASATHRRRRHAATPGAATRQRPASPAAAARRARLDDRTRLDLHARSAPHARRPTRRRRPRRGRRARRCTLPADGGTYTLYYLFPLDDEQQTLALVDPRPADGRRAAAAAGRGADLAGDPPGRHPDPDGPAGGRAPRRRPAPGAAAGDRGGRPRPAGDVVQPDGDQPPAPDPAAGGAEPRPAAVRLRRLPRAAHAADHGAAGRRRAARRPGGVRPRPVGRRSCCRCELDRFETLLVDLLEISRFDAGAAALDLDDVNLPMSMFHVIL